MKAPRIRSKRPRRADSNQAAEPPLDVGETRALVIAAAFIALFLYLIRAILLPFVLAGVVAYLCTPLLDWLAQRTRLPRILFVIAVFLLLTSLAALIIFFAGEHFVDEVKSTFTDLQGTTERLARQAFGDQPVQLLGQSTDARAIAASALDAVRDWFGQPDRIALVTGYSLAATMGSFLTTVLLFYFLVSGRTIARGVLWVVPPHRRDLARRIWLRLDPVLTRYFLGVIAVVIYATIAAYVGLGLILGIDHAVLLALLTGILETVPVIGPTAAAVIAGLAALHTATSLKSILAYALYATLLRLSIDQIVGPLVLGRAGRVHPVLIIFSFLSGAILLGIPGVILAVPIALALKNTLATLYGDYRT
jgi:predicted PurR-regulated permease PerM